MLVADIEYWAVHSLCIPKSTTTCRIAIGATCFWHGDSLRRLSDGEDCAGERLAEVRCDPLAIEVLGPMSCCTWSMEGENRSMILYATVITMMVSLTNRR